MEALSTPREERTAMLRDRCGGDATLMAEVASLLGAHDADNGLLDSAVFAPGGPGLQRGASPMEALPHGRRIGAYTVLGVLGSGGMGVVYVAEQERPRRTVALKVIRPGLATPQLLRRFEHEAETLGRLHHPGIAQIYEAGAADTGLGPQPFFAMELVKGKPLTTHAEERRLDHRARMALVALVCDAVQHAHQRGVIHRDLKPGNILVDESGQPKVLDFGVSRVASADVRSTSIETSVGQLIGTLPYMSPEQVGGAPDEVDTRTDVYAMGVVLYQVLTGRLPHDVGSRSIPEAARVIRDETPARLSSVSKIYRGEVDTIVSTAIEKDKTRRYQSAAALADDIRRYLEGAPIAAKRDSAMYVLRKQIKRHRVAAAATVVIATLIVGFGIASALQARANSRLAKRESVARLEADRSRDVARKEQAQSDADAERLRRGLYFSRIGYAQAAYYSHDTENMRALLEECPLDLRGWEWGFLSNQVDDSAATVVGAAKTAGISQLINAGPDRLLTYDAFGVVRLWDGETHALVNEFPTGVRLAGAAASADGSTLYITTIAGTEYGARAVDIRTQQILWSVPRDVGNLGMCLPSRDGKSLVIAGRQGACAVLDAATGLELATFSNGREVVGCASLSPDGKTVVLGDALGHYRLWDVPTVGLLGELPWRPREARAVAFSPDGTRIVTGGADGAVRIWDAATRAELRTIRGHENKVWCVAFSPDGRWVASAGTDTTILISEVATGDPVATLHGNDVTVTFLAFTCGGKWLVSVSREGLMRWWAMPPQPATPFYYNDPHVAKSVAVSPDGKRIVAGWENGFVSFHDSVTLERLSEFKAHDNEVWAVVLSSDGTRLYTASWDGSVRMWDPSTGARLADAALDGGRIYRAALRPGAEDEIAVVSHDGCLRLLRADTLEERLKIKAHDSVAVGVGWSPDGSRLASAGGDFKARIWNAADGSLIRTLSGHEHGVYAAIWTSDGKRIVTGSEDWTMRVWDVETGQEERRLLGHKGAIYCLALNPRGDRIVSGSFDNMIKVWDFETGQDLLTLRGHLYSVTSVSFSPDGAWLVSGNDDNTIRVWGRPRAPR